VQRTQPRIGQDRAPKMYNAMLVLALSALPIELTQVIEHIARHTYAYVLGTWSAHRALQVTEKRVQSMLLLIRT